MFIYVTSHILGYDGNRDGKFSRTDIQDNPASILYAGEF